MTIARLLSEEKIYTPSYYITQQEGRSYKNATLDDPYRWNGPTVNTIIGRLEYTGAMVSLRSEKSSFKDKVGKKLPQDRWLVFPDKHEPIVDNATWQSANDILAKKKRTKPNEKLPEHHLTGLLYCATCGSKMHHNRSIVKATGKRRNYYTCKLSKKGSDHCTEHRVRGDHVEELVLETLKTVCNYTADHKQEFLTELHKFHASKQVDTVRFQQKRLSTAKLRHGELDKLIQRIYEDNVAGKINDNRYQILYDQYEQEQQDLTDEIDQLQADIGTHEDTTIKADSFLKLVDRYTEFSELTPAMLNEFVNRIEVHERAEKRVRSTSQRIDIHLNFIGAYVPPTEYIQAHQPQPETPPDSERMRAERQAKRQYQQEYKQRREANGGLPLRYKDGVIASVLPA